MWIITRQYIKTSLLSNICIKMAKQLYTIFFALILVIKLVCALPVIKNQSPPPPIKNETEPQNLETALEYERYLREVVEALENDSEFRKKLDKSPEADIRNGKIAQELEYVSHNVRSKLDEIKRKELERLRHLASKRFELNNEIDREHLKINDHVDHSNEHTFEIRDLEKLIIKTSKDLAEADKLRREEFKQYEMQKEFEKQAILQELDEPNKKKFEEEIKEKVENHKKHEKVHHPGNKAQLEEVWENQDHMEGQDFNPKTFFMIHDVDGNGYWDETELKALFVKELEKVYQSGLPEDDIREKAEDMERMREHVFAETDINRDGLISYQEFVEQTKKEEFQKDPEWETVENVPQFTHEEYLDFERKRQEEVKRLISQGLLPPHPNMPQGYYPNQNYPNNQQHPNQPIQYNHENNINQPQYQQIHYDQQMNPNQPNNNHQTNYQQLNNQPTYNQPINNQQMNNQPMNNQPINNQQMNNQPINNQQMNNQPVNNQQMNNQQFNNQQLNNQPINNQQNNVQNQNNQHINSNQPNNKQQLNSNQINNQHNQKS